MFGYQMRRTSVLCSAVAAVLSLGFVNPASAAPSPGMRWSDHAWGSSSRPPASSRTQPARVGPTCGYPRSSSDAPPVAYTPTPAPIPSAGPTTLNIRNTDGTLRTFPVEGPAVVQQPAVLGRAVPAFVSVRDADGVVRSYPVVSPGHPAAVPAMPGPCR